MPEPTLPTEKSLQEPAGNNEAIGKDKVIGKDSLGVNQEIKISPQSQENTLVISNFLMTLGVALESLAGPSITVLRLSWQQHNGYKLEVVGNSGQPVPENSGSDREYSPERCDYYGEIEGLRCALLIKHPGGHFYARR